MSFTEIFGGNVVYPAGQTYLELTFSADVQLQWPIEQAISGVPVVASIMDLDATLPGLNVDLPDARQVSNGIQSVFTNFGANTVTVRDADGGAIVSLDSGQSWLAYLTDNTTNAGSWRIFQLGATVSVANASALAGAGLKAIATTLNQSMPPASTAITPVTLTDADRAMLTIWTGGVGVLDLPAAATVGADWFTIVRNSGTGDLTVTPPSGLINGFATLVLSPDQSTFIVTDGTNWFTVGLGLTASSTFDFVQINVAGSGDYTLSGSELNRIAYRFNGLLTNDRTIIVPSTVQQYWVDNSTTGAFSLFVKTLPQAGSGVEVFQGGRQIVYCDGADVVDADTSQFPVPLPVVSGGTGATAIADWPVVKDLAVDTPAPGDFFVFQDIDDSDQNKKGTLGTFPASQLVDSGGNVRVSAELLGLMQLRSDGNTDGEIRTMVGTHQDGTIRWGVGQPTISTDLIIENLMVGGDIEIRSGPASPVTLYAAGTLRVVASSLAGQVDVFADGNTDTEAHYIQLKDSSGNIKGSWGWTATQTRMHIQNLINGQDFELRGENFGGQPRTYLFADPDAETTFLYAGNLPGIGAQDRTAAGASTGGVVVDSQSNPFPVGFNVIPGRTISTNQTLDDDWIGRMWEKATGGAITITLPNDTNIPQGATIMLGNIDTENISINQGGGVTLRWFDGTTTSGLIGNRTLASGGVATIRKSNNTNFQIWGVGLS